MLCSRNLKYFNPYQDHSLPWAQRALYLVIFFNIKRNKKWSYIERKKWATKYFFFTFFACECLDWTTGVRSPEGANAPLSLSAAWRSGAALS
jgi:hypothetical protein